MASNISNRTFPVSVRVPFVRFCQSVELKMTIIPTDDGAAFRVACASVDYPFAIDAADAIEASQTAEAAWLAEYLANPRMKPCAVGTFSEPLSRRLDDVRRDHWHNSGRRERVRDEWEAATVDLIKARKVAGWCARGRKRAKVAAEASVARLVQMAFCRIGALRLRRIEPR